MSNEAEFLGNLFPSHPDLLPIIQSIREKYGLPEINPDSEPISEIYLVDKLIPLEVFRQDIEDHVRENLSFFPPKFVSMYKTAKSITEMTEIKELDEQPISQDLKDKFRAMFEAAKLQMQPFYVILNAQIVSVANMLYEYILTGDAGEIPEDWFGKVFEMNIMETPTIIAMATSLTDLEQVVAQIRSQYRKSFGTSRTRLTTKKVGASYYLQLRRLGKKWDFIVEEYIRLNQISLPQNRTSKKYYDSRQRHERTLRRLLDRSEKILSILIK